MSKDNKRKVIIDEMFPNILEAYDDYYNGTSDFESLTEVGDFLNEKFSEVFLSEYDFDESAYRKQYNLIIKGFKRGLKHNATEEEINRLAMAQIRNKKNSLVMNAKNKIINKAIKKETMNKLINDEILSFYNEYTPKDFKLSCNKDDKEEEYPLYFWADCHYGLIMKIENKERKLKNIVSPEIVSKSFNTFINFIIQDVKDNNYKRFGVAGLGDDIEGLLRPSAMLETTLSITEQALECSNLYIQGFDLLLNELKDIDTEIDLFFVESSNHSQVRLFGAKRDEMPNEDFGKVIANQLLMSYRNNDKINVIVDKIIIANILGKRVAMLHGHQYSKKELFSKIDKRYTNIDYVFAGHYHSFDVEVHYSKKNYTQMCITVPSIVGDTAYSTRLGYSAGANALKVIINKRNGVSHYQLITVR